MWDNVNNKGGRLSGWDGMNDRGGDRAQATM